MNISGTYPDVLQSGTITLTGGAVSEFTFHDVIAPEGIATSGTATVIFTDSPTTTYTFTFVVNTLTQN